MRGQTVSEKPNHVFLSYGDENEAFVESLAVRLRGDARIGFWFRPWHAIPGQDFQVQMEEALWTAQSCAVFISSDKIEGWQNEQMRAAIMTRVEDEPGYRVIPVLVPGATKPRKRNLPRFLRLYEMVEFHAADDEPAFNRLLAGILGIPPIEVEGFTDSEKIKAQLPPSPTGFFEQGYALVIGIANYPQVNPLPETILNDARDIRDVLTNTAKCGYHPDKVIQLLDTEATNDDIRTALGKLAARTGPDDTVVVFFSGHGAHTPQGGDTDQYILPYEADLSDLPGTTIAGSDMTAMLGNIKAGRLVVFFDSCHSGGAGDPKGIMPHFKAGLSEGYYQALAQGRGRVVMASSRSDELSWVLAGMRNSLFTHYLLEALRGQTRTLGDGYVRVFDIFRHVAEQVPQKASQHPIFKATAMEEDFPIALIKS